MVNTNALKATFMLEGYTAGTAADAIGMPRSTMYYKLRTGNFTIPECDAIIRKFHIEHWEEVFPLGRKE